jgi:hypothetical protein
MAKHLVMDQTGHSEHLFDQANIVEVAEAERRFKELTGKGFTAAKRTAPGKSELIKSFDPTIEETLFIPALRGG